MDVYRSSRLINFPVKQTAYIYIIITRQPLLRHHQMTNKFVKFEIITTAIDQNMFTEKYIYVTCPG